MSDFRPTDYNKLPNRVGGFLNLLNRHNINPFNSELFEYLLFALVAGIPVVVLLLVFDASLKVWLIAGISYLIGNILTYRGARFPI